MRNMRDVNNLRGIDLNLLVVLEALLVEQHVSRASLRLGMSQPAVSHALARLRDMFSDPLLVRRNGALIQTAKAKHLAPLVSNTLQQVRLVVGPGQFDAASEHLRFRIAMSDYGSSVVLPSLGRLLRHEAPGIDIIVTHSDRQGMLRQTVEGEIDLALGVFPDSQPELNRSLLFDEQFTCVAAAGTLDETGSLGLDAYLERPHVLLAMGEAGNNEIDAELARIGRSRRIAITLPHWGVAEKLIADTDLVLTVARRTLDRSALDPNVGLFDPPFSIPSFPFTQIWHDRRTLDPAHKWLRQAVARAASPSFQSSPVWR